MPQDQSPERRAYGPAEPPASQPFDPVDFARRLDLARIQRAEVLARRSGAAAAHSAQSDRPADAAPAPPGSAARTDADPAGRPDARSTFTTSSRAPVDLAFPRPSAQSPEPASASALRRPPAPEPLVAPPRRPAAPSSSAGAPRAVAIAALLLFGAAIAASPDLRDRAAHLASGFSVLGGPVAIPAPPPAPPERLQPPQLASAPASIDATIAAAPTAATDAGAEPAPRLPLLRLAGPAGISPPPGQPLETAAPPSASLVVVRPSAAVAPPAPGTPPPLPPVAVALAPTIAGAAPPALSAALPADSAAPDVEAPAGAVAAVGGVPRPTVAAAAAAVTTGLSAGSPSIAVHAPPGVSPAALDAAIGSLRAAGFDHATGVRVRMTIERTHVRYYHAADASAANRLAATLGPDAEARDFTHFSPPPAPGRLEVWLSSAAAAQRAAATASPGPSPPSFRPGLSRPAATVAASPRGPALVVGRKTSLALTRPASPLLDRLYAAPGPTARAPAPGLRRPASGDIGSGGVY